MTRWPPEFEMIIRKHCRRIGAGVPVDAETSLLQLGVDSMAIVTIVLEIEEAFGISIPDELLAGEDSLMPGRMWEAVEMVRRQSSAFETTDTASGVGNVSSS
jgi:acyl carrier protein